MAVPPRPGHESHPTFESELRDDATPRVPRPLPDRGSSRMAAAMLLAAGLIVIALIVLL